MSTPSQSPGAAAAPPVERSHLAAFAGTLLVVHALLGESRQGPDARV